MDTTYKIIKSDYGMKPETVASALIDIITHINDPKWLADGPHRRLMQSLDSCLNKASTPDCILDLVEKVISVFIADSSALSKIAKHLEDASTDKTKKDVMLANAYIHEVYLSSRGLEIGESKQKELLKEIKIDILRQQVVSEKNRTMIHSLETNLNANAALDKKQSELINTIEAQLNEKASLDDQQSELIDQIKKAFVEKTMVDLEQSELLGRLEAIIEKKDDIDAKQTQSLLKIKEELISKTIKDIEQSSAIDKLESRLYDMQMEIESLHRKYRDAGQGALDRDRLVLGRMNKHTLVMAVIGVYMLLLSMALFIRF